ncbi:thiol reductant ABC exporter subunit CydC [Aquisalimonas lutea]|uniref:thiol reductant ABC exporter subunit CydC n=1 Tax=Aquisalimonas lutea TaxID=1327750 RepID=UPI0025B4743A|nr:thiol reductant ABC exporter subunit CydC [Aquisalimonas lutea]MDN3518258.1 thiol reductant ABC exporter subunit CydC [Aquisalimonas lutea]
MRELWLLWRMHLPRWRWLAAGAALMLAATLANFGLLALSGWFITATGLAGLAGTALDIYRPGAGIRFFAVGRAASRYGERLVTHEAVLRLLADLRVRVFRRLMGLDPARLAALRSGDTLTRLTADVDRLDQFYLRVLAPTAVAVVGLAMAGLVLALFAPAPSLVVVALVAAVAVAAAWTTGRLARRPGREQVRLGSRLREHLVGSLDGLAEMHIHGGVPLARARFRALADGYEGAERTLSRLAGLTQALASSGTLLALWLAAVSAIPLVRADTLSGPGFALILVGTLALTEFLMPLPLAVQALSRTRSAARRVLTTAPREHPSPASSTAGPGDGTLAFHEAVYRYTEDGRPVVDQVSLALEPGTHVAITGGSGSGKSTLLALAAGIRTPQAGSVWLGGDPVSSLSPEAVGRRAAWLPQRTIVFGDTVAGNLRLAAPDAPEEMLWQALRTAALEDTVAALPDGLETWVGVGGRALSGGEARRLCLARTLLQPAPVLLLDEPTRGLEAETAEAVLRQLLEHARERAVLIVTHDPDRLPTTVARRRLRAGRLLAAI